MKSSTKYKQYWASFEVLHRVSGKTNSHLHFVNDLKPYRDIFNHIERMITHEGERQTVKYIKTLRVIVYKIVAGEHFDVSFMKLHKATLTPSILGPKIGRALRSREKLTIRMLLSLLQISYIITDNKLIPEVSSISGLSTANNDSISEIVSFVSSHVKDILPNVGELPEWTDPHESTSAGPLGPAVWTIPLELSLLTDDMISHISEIGGQALKEYLHNCHNNKELLQRAHAYFAEKRGLPVQGANRYTLRRLVAIPAPECKTRVIAILDWWSQTALLGVHRWSFDLLSSLKSDMTFNQDGFKTVLPKTGPYFSFDLSSATDRFPIKLQKEILSLMIGEKKATAWESLLTNDTFTCSWDSSAIKYGAGQPMGAYSSWSVFSLCHHFVVHFCAMKAGFKPGSFWHYCLLGDDIVIADSLVARYYKEAILSLGVGISEQKSLVSIDTFEFAKRIFHCGEELTSFPLAAIVENHKSITALWSTLLVAKDRDFSFLSPYSNPGLVAEFQRANGLIIRQTERIAKELESLYALLHQTDEELRNWGLFQIIKQFRLSAPCTTDIDELLHFLSIELGGCVVKYQGQLLNETTSAYLDLRRLLTEDFIEFLENERDSNPEGTTSQMASTTLARDYPLLRIMSLATLRAMRESNELRRVLSEGPSVEFLRLTVTPVGDLSRIISRMVNVKATARQAAFLQFLRAEVAVMATRRSRALKGDF